MNTKKIGYWRTEYKRRTNTIIYTDRFDPKWTDPESDPAELRNQLNLEVGVTPGPVVWVETIRPPMVIKSKATIVRHSTIWGIKRQEVREVTIYPPDRIAQYDGAVRLYYKEPRKRRGESACVEPDNIEYITVEVGGKTVYDSRDEVPCDMAVWTAHRAEWAEQTAEHRRMMA